MIKTKTVKKGNSLEQMLERLKNPASAMEAIGRVLVSSTKKRLSDTKMSPDETPWAPWAPSTLLARTKDGTASKGLLFNTGTLSKSIEAQVTKSEVIVGASASYAPYLQEGTTNMPGRPFIGISQLDQTHIQNILMRYLKKQ